jgi:hypothetical protein
MGRPWQKCRTSEIHCGTVSEPLGQALARGSYLLLHVVERVGRVDSEANQDNMRIGVRERAETVVIFLASGIPEGELNVFAIDFDVGNVVLEDSGDVDLLRRACQCVCNNEICVGAAGAAAAAAMDVRAD